MTRRLKFREKLAFGLGDFGGNFCFSFLSSFALIYFTDIVGASAGVVATLLMVAKCFDGVTDFVMGHLIDKTNTKMGKARPWLFWSAFPLAIALIMMFNVPAGLSAVAKLIYIFVIYVLLCAFFYTANNISYNALTSLVTDNAEDRVSMGSVRFMFTAVAGIIIGALTTVLISAFGSGQKGWTMVAFLYAGIFLASTMITVFGLKEMSGATTEAKKETEIGFGKSVKALLTNRYFIEVFFIFLVMYIYTGASATSGIYYATYILGNEDLYGLLSIAMMIPMFISLIFAGKIVEKLGMRKTAIASAILFAVGSLITVMGNSSLGILLAGIIIRSLGMGPISTLLFAFIAEVSDNITYTQKLDVTGMVYSCSSIGIKVGTGLGTAIVGWMLTLGKYDGSLTVQSAGANLMITAAYAVVPLIIGIVMIVLFAIMNVEKDNEKYRQNV